MVFTFRRRQRQNTVIESLAALLTTEEKAKQTRDKQCWKEGQEKARGELGRCLWQEHSSLNGCRCLEATGLVSGTFPPPGF